MRTLVWFRGKDLRVADHAPLLDAASRGEVVPLFVLDPYFFEPARAARIPHRMQVLLDGVRELAGALERLGSRLVLEPGPSVEVVPRLARAWAVDRVVAQRWTDPLGRARDARVAEALGVPFELFEGETLHVPGSLRTGAGQPFSVFTPFSRAFEREVPLGRPLAAPRALPPLPSGVRAPRRTVPRLEDLGLSPNPALPRGGEGPAHARLQRFLDGPARDYAQGRDALGRDATSRLSVDLKFGTLSPRTVHEAARRALEDAAPAAWRAFANELRWREFAHAVLHDRPWVLQRPFRAEWTRFPWDDDAGRFRAWAEGETGVPLVDAAARQLRAEGFVHNRARMVAASFLCKHLLQDYRRGEAHYLRWLADGDPAQNNLGWQWSAGAGCDAQPWFRIFNPAAQGERFDADGAYVRRWVPELARLPDRWLHRPHEAPPEVLREAGVTLGRTYPLPVVDHAQARARFLAVAKAHLAQARNEADRGASMEA